MTARTRVRIVDVAAVAEVSPMAAAAVLNGAGGKRIRVSAATAERVQKIANELGYRPNMVAQQLSGLPSRLIGIVGQSWFHALPLRVLSWLSKVADERDYRIISSQTHGRKDPLADYLRECDARGVDGVIYLAYNDDAIWEKARVLFKATPLVVALMGDPGIPHAHCVLSDFEQGIVKAVDHLYERGRRRIVQVLEDLDAAVNRDRYAGMQRAFETHALPFQADSICLATKGWEPNAPEFDNLVEELIVQRKADAVIADSDAGAISLMNACRRRGIRPGEDVAFIGWGHDTHSRLSVPTLTTVQFHLDQLCEQAVRLIAEHTTNSEALSPQTIIVPVDLVIRESS